MNRSNQVYIFNAHKSGFASAVFSSYRQAEGWIKRNYLSGILTEYPLNQSCYDWAKAHGHFKERSAIDRAPIFIAKFVSAYQKNWHFSHGQLMESIDG
ncbi:hypothetical protein BEN74_07015 [Acinetobacter sp. WCHAc010034]|jgi:hypothetical protein|uniref:DUF7710 domain-containing protein n=1 Tax=Acinetobacter sp. WCHAc010034 TaxID=1879049 RepID=UPI00083B5C03|nr:hypothetical protein [Acinetobacter sp. WCHAc010034]AYA02628.1 hypothetical protein BEN74_07015 [Acinetobacter sp. WCHAc010034]MBL8322625.1 hypothetical protein [Acinetobacter sp.]